MFKEKYGVYNFEKEYKEIQSNVADYWLASTKEDKLKFYCRFKTAIAIFKLKKKIGVIDFDATTEVPKFGLPKSGAMIMQEYLHSLSVIDKVINMHTIELLDDILNYYSSTETLAAYNKYSKDKLCPTILNSILSLSVPLFISFGTIKSKEDPDDCIISKFDSLIVIIFV